VQSFGEKSEDFTCLTSTLTRDEKKVAYSSINFKGQRLALMSIMQDLLLVSRNSGKPISTTFELADVVASIGKRITSKSLSTQNSSATRETMQDDFKRTHQDLITDCDCPADFQATRMATACLPATYHPKSLEASCNVSVKDNGDAFQYEDQRILPPRIKRRLNRISVECAPDTDKKSWKTNNLP
jgi:hypothetical protein